MNINTGNSKIIKTDSRGNIFILAEILVAESWAILSLTTEEAAAENVPFQLEGLFDTAEEALSAWNNGWELLDNGWTPEDDESIEDEEQPKKTVAKRAQNVIKKPSRKI